MPTGSKTGDSVATKDCEQRGRRQLSSRFEKGIADLIASVPFVAAPALASFRPLPHRLQPLGEHHGFHWINDSISTTPLATLAALESLHGRAVTVLVGGHDRSLDWTLFVDAMRAAPPHAIVCMGANGARIEASLRAAAVECPLVRVADLAAAIAEARACTPPDGVILLSPGAPSFDQFKDYAERGRRFAQLAGFDGAAIAGIDGVGIA